MKKFLLLLLSLSLLAITGCSSVESFLPNNATTSENSTIGIKFERGLINDGVYTNTSLSIIFTPTSNMTLSSNEDMYVQNDSSDEAMDYIDEMVATDNTTGSNIQIFAKKVPDSNTTVEEYLNDSIDQITNSEYYTVEDAGEIEDYDLCGSTYSKCTMHVDDSGSKFTGTLICKKVGDRFFTIVITCVQDEELKTFLSCFSPLK